MGTALMVIPTDTASSACVNPDGSVEYVEPSKWEMARLRRAKEVQDYLAAQRAGISRPSLKVAEESAQVFYPELTFDECCAEETYIPTLNMDGTNRHRYIDDDFGDIWQDDAQARMLAEIGKIREVVEELDFHNDDDWS